MNEEKLTTAAIIANIDHYECLVSDSKEVTQKLLCQLQYWLDRLEKQQE
jgi:hypothetical protein